MEKTKIIMKLKAKFKDNLTPLGDLIQFIENNYSVKLSDLKGRSRNRGIFRARQAFSYLLGKKLGWSSVEIGKFLDRDHSTILHSLKEFNPYEHPAVRSYGVKRIVIENNPSIAK